MNSRNSFVPSLEEWKALSDLERAQFMSEWNTYGGEGGMIGICFLNLDANN
jgi:hypothetical protein